MRGRELGPTRQPKHRGPRDAHARAMDSDNVLTVKDGHRDTRETDPELHENGRRGQNTVTYRSDNFPWLVFCAWVALKIENGITKLATETT